MAIAAQEQVSPEIPAPKRGSRQPGAAWSSSAQLWRSLPMLRLLAAISAIPQVHRVGVAVDGAGVYVRVLMSSDDREAEKLIFDAERDYLNGTTLHSFDLMVSDPHRVPETIRDGLLHGFSVVLER
jgi:hypothetical protein